jgi:hypothetical protein
MLRFSTFRLKTTAATVQRVSHQGRVAPTGGHSHTLGTITGNVRLEGSGSLTLMWDTLWDVQAYVGTSAIFVIGYR